jgi:four helix bundle protein
MELAINVYQATAGFPKEEIYGLSLQARRSAVSIPSNIAEGAARRSSKEFVQYLYIALGSAAELETQLFLAERMGFLIEKRPIDLLNETRKMLVALIRSLDRKPITRHPSLVTSHDAH